MNMALEKEKGISPKPGRRGTFSQTRTSSQTNLNLQQLKGELLSGALDHVKLTNRLMDDLVTLLNGQQLVKAKSVEEKKVHDQLEEAALRIIGLNAFPEERLVGLQTRCFHEGISLLILDCKTVILKLRLYEKANPEEMKEQGESFIQKGPWKLSPIEFKTKDMALQKWLPANPEFDRYEMRRDLTLRNWLHHDHLWNCYAGSIAKDPHAPALFAVDYTQGLTLSELINKKKIFEKRLWKVVSDVSDALSYCHEKRIAHRLVKCENVIVSEDVGLVKLFNFQSRKSANAQRKEKDKPFTGYIAPELFTMKLPLWNESTDVYCFGMMMYEMASRQVPFLSSMGNDVRAKAVRGERPILPEGVGQPYTTLMQKCWNHDPKARPSFSDIHKTAQEKMNEK